MTTPQISAAAARAISSRDGVSSPPDRDRRVMKVIAIAEARTRSRICSEYTRQPIQSGSDDDHTTAAMEMTAARIATAVRDMPII